VIDPPDAANKQQLKVVCYIRENLIEMEQSCRYTFERVFSRKESAEVLSVANPSERPLNVEACVGLDGKGREKREIRF
jgi:hypothetical protein